MSRALAEQTAWLRARQQAEWELLGAWWETRRRADLAGQRVAMLVAARDRQAGRATRMTPRQLNAAQQHARRGELVRDPNARRRLTRLAYTQPRVDAINHRWAVRLHRAQADLDHSNECLANLAVEVLSVWPGDTASELTGWSRRRLHRLAGRSS